MPFVGTVFNFRSGRNLGTSLGVTFFFIICAAASWVTITYGAHWIAIVVAGFFTLISGVAFLSAWFSKGTVTVYPDRVELISKFCGVGSMVNMPIDEMDSIELTQGMRSGDVVFYDLTFQRKDGYKKQVSSQIDGLVSAEALKKAIEGCIAQCS